MSDPKPMASLTSSLLAKKGDARPAIRRAYVPMASLDSARAALHDDLGWNDMGDDAPAPPAPPVRAQQARIAHSFAAPGKAVAAVAAQPRTAKAAFTLRLDADRHLRLRLASAVGNQSAQRLVTDALDAFLDGRPDLDALIAELRHPKP